MSTPRLSSQLPLMSLDQAATAPLAAFPESGALLLMLQNDCSI